MSRAVSAQYEVACPVCLAQSKQPCRSRTTRKVTDTHEARRQRQYDRPTRVGEWASD